MSNTVKLGTHENLNQRDEEKVLLVSQERQKNKEAFDSKQYGIIKGDERSQAYRVERE